MSPAIECFSRLVSTQDFIFRFSFAVSFLRTEDDDDDEEDDDFPHFLKPLNDE